MSVELAYVIAAEQVRASERRQIFNLGTFVLPDFMFKYEGRHSLKGVLGGVPYPIIWVDLAPEDPVFRAEDNVLRKPAPTAAEVLALTKAFIDSQSFLSPPYIEGCVFSEYSSLSATDSALLLDRYESINTVRESLVIEKDVEAAQGPNEPTGSVSVIQLDFGQVVTPAETDPQ